MKCGSYGISLFLKNQRKKQIFQIFPRFKFSYVILLYIAQVFVLRWKKYNIAMKTTCLFLLFTLYFIPTWLLIDRGSEDHHFRVPFKCLVIIIFTHHL